MYILYTRDREREDEKKGKNQIHLDFNDKSMKHPYIISYMMRLYTLHVAICHYMVMYMKTQVSTNLIGYDIEKSVENLFFYQ